MTLHVFTARMGSRDPDALDITRMSGRGDALAFAPSWDLLRVALDARKRADALMKEALEAVHNDHRDEWELAREAERITEEAWAAYVPAFVAEMRESYRMRRAAWDALLARERVVLMCFCTDATKCHRTLLARDILPRLGAMFGGELLAESAQKGLFDGR